MKAQQPVSSRFMPNTMLSDSVLFNIIKYYTGHPGKFSPVAQYISSFVGFLFIYLFFILQS